MSNYIALLQNKILKKESKAKLLHGLRVTRTGPDGGSAPRAHPAPGTHLFAFLCPRQSAAVPPTPLPSRRATPRLRGGEERRPAAHTEQPRSLLTGSLPRLLGSSSPPRSSGTPPAASCPAPAAVPAQQPPPLRRGAGAASPPSLTRHPQPAPPRRPSCPGGERGARRRGRGDPGPAAAGARTRGSAPRPAP